MKGIKSDTFAQEISINFGIRFGRRFVDIIFKHSPFHKSKWFAYIRSASFVELTFLKVKFRYGNWN